MSSKVTTLAAVDTMEALSGNEALFYVVNSVLFVVFSFSAFYPDLSTSFPK